jgi:hypothetical protein
LRNPRRGKPGRRRTSPTTGWPGTRTRIEAQDNPSVNMHATMRHLQRL